MPRDEVSSIIKIFKKRPTPKEVVKFLKIEKLEDLLSNIEDQRGAQGRRNGGFQFCIGVEAVPPEGVPDWAVSDLLESAWSSFLEDLSDKNSDLYLPWLLNVIHTSSRSGPMIILQDRAQWDEDELKEWVNRVRFIRGVPHFESEDREKEILSTIEAAIRMDWQLDAIERIVHIVRRDLEEEIRSLEAYEDQE